MKRNDSILYTGATSASNEPRTPRQEQKIAKQEARIKLKPAKDLVLQAIDRELNKVHDIRSITAELKLKPEELYTELKARQLYSSYLNSFKSIVELTLKEPKDEK